MVFGQLNARNINCFPLITAWIPCYVTIDTKILLQNIIGERWPRRRSVPNRPIWRRVVDLNRPLFKNQPRSPRLIFHCMTLTDGVGVSVLKSRRRPGQRQVASPAAADQPEFQYIHRLNEDDQALIQNNCVVMDPGRRGMPFFVHEDSDITTPMRFRYTKQSQDKNEKRKKFRRIRNRAKTRDFTQFIRERSEVHDILRAHYAGTLTGNDNHQYALHRKLKLSAKFNCDRADKSLIRNLQGRFPDATYIMGNWSAPVARFHEPLVTSPATPRNLSSNPQDYFCCLRYILDEIEQQHFNHAMDVRRVPPPRTFALLPAPTVRWPTVSFSCDAISAFIMRKPQARGYNQQLQ